VKSANLRVEHLTKHFGGVCAASDVSFVVESGDLLGLIGPNGSGKTTAINCITGYVRAENPSQVEWNGSNIIGMRPDEIARLGLGRTFQEARAYLQLSALENVLLAVQQHQGDSFLQRLLNGASIGRREAEATERAMVLLELVGLKDMWRKRVGELSYGQRKLLIFAAALAPEPALLLLDEPTAAVNPALIEQLKEHIREVNAAGQTILLVEHNMDVIMDLCSRVVVLDHGEKIADAPPEVVQADEGVIDAYFGT
jgi:branched-chain amino acid transport system ATP-binding protein